MKKPPSAIAKSYCSIYAYENHIWVHSGNINLNIYDGGVGATFSKACLLSTCNTNVQITNFEHFRWVEEIIGVDYCIFETLVQYCNWVKVNMVGLHATMRQDDYAITLVNFEKLILYFV